MSLVRVLINPASGDRRAVRRAREWAAASVPAVECVVTRDEEHLAAEARRAVADRIARLAVVGGDGSIHRVLDPLSGASTALGLVPAGTGNDLAEALGIDGTVEQCLERARTGPTRRIDLGDVAGRPFAGTGGVGLDGEVARRVRRSAIRRLGAPAYALAAIVALATYHPPRVRVEHDGGAFDGTAWFVVLANSPRFGGGMRIAPGARLDDGRLDLVIVRRTGRLALLRTLPRVYSGAHVDHPAVEVVRTRSATLTVDRAATAWGDGEPIVDVPSGPIRFSVRPAALAVVG